MRLASRPPLGTVLHSVNGSGVATMRAARFAIVMLVLLQGCGLKGPLYLPTAQQKRDIAERERLLREREARRQSGTVAPAPTGEPVPTEPVAPRQSDTDLLPEVAPPPIGEPPQMEPAAPLPR